MNALRIVFLGTPEFAVESLKVLVENHCHVVAVVTAPDKPQGRGQKLQPSPVKEYALNHQLPVLQPTNLKSAEFLEELRSYHADLQIVVAFRMLPEIVWSMPALGTFNLHGSLLPQYRGAAPINWAIMNGEKETGVTTFFLRHEIDTGAIIFQEKEPILHEDTAGTLYDRLMKKGAQLVLKTVRAIEGGTFPAITQDLTLPARHAPKIFKETCKINWDEPVEKVRDFVRGLSPYPAAWTMLNGKTFKLYMGGRAPVSTNPPGDSAIGAIQTDNKTYLWVRCRDGWFSVDELQQEGKRKMKIREYLVGNKL